MKAIEAINTVIQQIFVRLYTRGGSRADRQRGVSALEYIVLAAVLIAIILLLANSGLGTVLSDKFKALFSSASSVTSAT